MTWKCGECGRTEGAADGGDRREVMVFVDAVCHHCGKPLCSHRREGNGCQLWIRDHAVEATGSDETVACHCRACAEAHHPRASPGEPPEAVTDRRRGR